MKVGHAFPRELGSGGGGGGGTICPRNYGPRENNAYDTMTPASGRTCMTWPAAALAAE